MGYPYMSGLLRAAQLFRRLDRADGEHVGRAGPVGGREVLHVHLRVLDFGLDPGNPRIEVTAVIKRRLPRWP